MGVAALRVAVFLDRDGVLNRCFVREGVSHPPQTLEELEVLPDVPAAVARLTAAGLALVGVTNQPDVARGAQSREAVEAMNARLAGELGLLGILACFHDDADACACRKPRPGLLFEAARRFDLDLKRSVMIGDRWSDVVGGQAAGCRAILIENAQSHGERCAPDARAADLAGAAAIVLAWDLRYPRG